MFQRPPSEREWVSWLWVVLGMLVIYLTIPFARAISQFVGERWGRQVFLYGVLLSVGLGSITALYLLWLQRARTRRVNVLWMLLVGVLYVYFTLTLKANPEEALHFIEYGVLGVLLFRALSHRMRDPGIYVAGMLLGSMAGTFDEIIQWLTPQRVFDFRDVGFNALSGVLAQWAIWKGFAPGFIVPPVRPRTFRRICAIAAAQVVVLGACLLNTPEWTDRLVSAFPAIGHVRYKSSAMSEYGHRHVIPGMGIFYSRFTLEELQRIDRERAEEAAVIINFHHDPKRYGDFLRLYTPSTDPFLHELRVHLFRRDHYRAVAPKHQMNPEMFALHNTVAYRENEFVETFFPRTLRRSKFKMIRGHVRALKRSMDPRIEYESAVSRDLITSLTERQVRRLIFAALVVLGGAAAYSRWKEKRVREKA